MTESAVLLLEIGCEEIPDRYVEQARLDLGAAVHQAVRAAGLLPAAGSGHLRTFATPRRLAVRLEQVIQRQVDETQEVTGPPVGAAYAEDGTPTRAALGFAAGQGVEVSELYRVQGAKGEVVAARKEIQGQPALAVLAEILPAAVRSLRFPKTMSWGSGGMEFVRPIRWVVALLGMEIVPLTVAGVAAGRLTRPRRGSGLEPASLASADDYEETLRRCQVIVDVDERVAAIQLRLQEAAATTGGRAVEDADLLATVTHLVEYPGGFVGAFPAVFLELPREVLSTTLRHHQRCMSVAGPDGRLLPRFIAVVNMPDDPDGAVQAGYERVIAGRLADARFFHEEDKHRPLQQHGAMLERTRYHADLGSYAEKVRRLQILGSRLCDLTGAPAEVRRNLERATSLSKCDLTTQMENEFPELQGVVGGIYARDQGEPEAVWQAIYDQYLPGGMDDALPRGEVGALLSVADRLDTLVGLLGVGVVPKGSRDPFALRRAAQGLVRIMVERPLALAVPAALQAARASYADQQVKWKLPEAELLSEAGAFLGGRLRFLMETSGAHRYDSIAAVMEAGWDLPAVAVARLEALTLLRGEEDFTALAAAAKRIRNIVSQAEPGVSAQSVAEELLVEPAERELHSAAVLAAVKVKSAVGAGDHAGALRILAALGPQVDHFFDKVLVMAEDAKTRRNRLALLATIGALYRTEAEFAEIVVEGNS